MIIRKILLSCLLLLFITAGSVFANSPEIGFLYPAGGQKGTVVRITAGGQFLRQPKKVYVTGQGVTAEVIGFGRQFRKLNRDQREIFNDRVAEVTQKRISELPPNIRRPIVKRRELAKERQAKNAAKRRKRMAAKLAEQAKKKGDSPVKKTPAEIAAEKKTAKVYKLPKHPMFDDLENKSLKELEHIKKFVLMRRSLLLMNKQISELVTIEVTIDANAKPGRRELRIQTRDGLSNPVVFQIGSFQENCEVEPNDQKAYTPIKGMEEIPLPKAIKLPAVLNGQIMPGDVDRFRFRAEKGQKLVIEAHARSLIPYLADAVPGWFQATIALYRASGTEVAYADDYQFSPDPVMYYEIDRTGEYELEIRDSIYRGREDFVYRIVVGEQPFVTQMFPLGGKASSNVIADVDGWNLDKKTLRLDLTGGDRQIRNVAAEQGGCVSNAMPYQVSEYKECLETESNDSISDAHKIVLPTVINGRIETAGDKDVYSFSGKKDQQVVAEVYARRLNSPLDSLLQITDANGKVIKWNDDFVVKDSHLHKDVTGLVTHHADSYLIAALPRDGTYFVHLSDTQKHGGRAYGYRLRLCPRVGDFALRITPSGLHMYSGDTQPLRVHALRTDGFEGPIEVALKDAPEGFEISGGTIPAGCNMIDMTLTAPTEMESDAVALEFEGRVNISDKTVTRQAFAAEDTMQAFLYRHLVPAEEFLVTLNKRKWRLPKMKRVGDQTVTLEPGGSTEVVMRTKSKKVWLLKSLKLSLHNPPEGISISNIKAQGKQLSFIVKADESIARGFQGNLIVKAAKEYLPKGKNGKPNRKAKKRKTSFGILPAIPITVSTAK